MKDGRLPAEDGSFPEHQDLVVSLLERILGMMDIVEEKFVSMGISHAAETNHRRKGKIDERFKETYDKLMEIRNHLEKLTMTQAWALRETDLYSWQRKLDRIDDSRQDGNFFDAEGRPADIHAQRVSLLTVFARTSSVFGGCLLTAIDNALSPPQKLRPHIPTPHFL